MEKDKVGMILIFLGMLWAISFDYLGQETIGETQYNRETYSDDVRGLASMSILIITFYPSYRFMRKGWDYIVKKHEKDIEN